MWYNKELNVIAETHSEIRSANPQVSMPKIMTVSNILGVGFLPLTGIPPVHDHYTQHIVELDYVLNGAVYERTFEIIDFTGKELTDGLALKKSDIIKQAERVVESYINTQCVSLGYDNVNSIAKYLTNENDFYAECQSLSLWIGKVWTKTLSIQADVEAGTISEPTPEELVAMLPVYV